MPNISCPNGHRLQITDRHIGQTIKCPTCQASFVAEAGGEGFAFEEPDRTEDRGSPPRGTEDGGSPPRGGKGLLGGYALVGLVNSFVGKPLLFFGLILVILGRGCDATSMRSVSRSDAYYRQAKVGFQLDWDAKLSAMQQKIEKKNRQISDAFDSGEKKDGDFQKRLNDLQKEKGELDKEQRKLRGDHSSALAENENGSWKPLRETALKALNNHRMSIYWYEWLFIFGTVVLVLGVLTLAFTGQGPERWVAYILIAIITFSIYVGEIAWIESIVTSAGSGTVAPIERPAPFPR